MALDFEQLIGLWTRPLPQGPEAMAAFARVYAERLKVNGVETTLEALVERARALQAAYEDLGGTLLARADTATHTTIVFRMRGRHVGRLTTPLGVLEPTGKVAERQVIDLLAVRDGRIEEVWMVADELSALVQLGALRLG
jgi:ketosteroid isomerase-like protein